MPKKEIPGILFIQKHNPLVIMLKEKGDLVPIFTGTLEDISHSTPRVVVFKVDTFYMTGDQKLYQKDKMLRNRCSIDLATISRAGAGYLIIDEVKGMHPVIPQYDPKGRMSVFYLDSVQEDICAR